MNLKGRKFENSRLDMEIFVYEIEGKEWFIGNDMSILLGYSNYQKALQQHVWKENKKSMYIKTLENIGNGEKKVINNNRAFITKEGVLQLISKSQKITQQQKQEWYRMFGVVNVCTSRKEIEFGDTLKKSLNELELKVISQYNIDDKYRVDFYIPQLNIAVEYDEEQHDYLEKEDKEREDYIKGKLGCQFVRCDFRDSDIKNVMKVVKKCNEEYLDKVVNWESVKRLINTYCSQTYIDEIKIVSEDNYFLHIQSFGYDYIISKTKDLQKLIAKTKEIQQLKTVFLLIPQSNCSTNELVRILIHGLELCWYGDEQPKPLTIQDDKHMLSYFYYKKHEYYGDGIDFNINLKNMTVNYK